MQSPSPTLHLLCGKIAAGKSTLARRLVSQPGTVLIAEDEWLNALFSGEMSSGADYLHYAAKLREIMSPHIASLLNAGVSVVLDFPANTVENRAWMRCILNKTNASHRLHFLDVPDHICLTRLRERNVQGNHAFAVTDEQFRRFSSHFVAPDPDEGFHVMVHRAEA